MSARMCGYMRALRCVRTLRYFKWDAAQHYFVLVLRVARMGCRSKTQQAYTLQRVDAVRGHTAQ
jgi:hypothetical protein